MTGNVKCTCGWSWNKSDSSKKDMYVCHECGRDNSNNMKNGGWLDNYGEEDNYNDSQASAPEGMEGDGFSNVGRNSSPAWGGQFQEGGKVPLYVESKNDPRYKAYKDSLMLYRGLDKNKVSEKMLPGIKNIKPIGKKTVPYFYNQKGEKQTINTSTKKVVKSEAINRNVHSTYVKDIYKKPEQQVIVKPTTTKKTTNSTDDFFSSGPPKRHIDINPILPIENNLRPAGLVEPDFELEADVDIHNRARIPQYYDVTDKVNQNFGGSETQYKYYPENGDLPDVAPSPYNTRTVTPHYQMGGNVYPVNYVPQAQMGGSIPGAVGFSYARTQSPAPSNGKYAKKTMASAQNGKEMQYYQNGLDWKPKSISKNGAWLDNYDEAQEGINLPSVRDLITDTMNRKIQERKGKGKETKVTQKDNTKTVTPKIGKVATAKEKEQRAIEENKQAQEASELQARKDWVQGSMEEAYKSPLMSPGYFTPEGVAIGALQGATKLGPDLYEGNYKGAAIDALMALPIGIPAAKGLGRALGPEEGLMGKVSQEVNINRNLNKIKKEGQLEGLSDYEIAKKQMEQVGITSNQRKAYTPIVSEFAEKYIRPVGYGGTGFGNKTKLAQTIDNIKRGGFNTEEVMPTRLDAWKLYLGRPQVNETFNLADTAPVIHPSYKPGSLEGMDIYNINSKEILSTVAPDIRPVNFRKNDYMNVLENPISISNDPEIMGGYNRVMTKQGTQYNDIWDLDPAIKLKSLFPNKVSENSLLENVFYKTNTAGVQTPRGIKIPVSKFFGKPFMSHGNVPTTSNQYVEALKETLKDKLLFRENFSPEQIRQYTKDLTNLKNYPKFKKGGIIKDDRGQWGEHKGEPTRINQSEPGSYIDMGPDPLTDEPLTQPLLGISDKGERKIMYPGEKHKYKKGTKYVDEFPIAKNGLRQEQKGLQNLDNLLNFTNYNTKQPGGWLDTL